jgi:SAM-dependent methyltransferase
VSGLPKDRDAYGHGLLDFLQGDASNEVVERDDGLIEPDVGPSGYFAPYRSWPAMEKRAMRYVRGRVLDVGAGAGRVALRVQEQGLDVVAIDNSPLAVKVCLLRGVKDARVVPFTQVSSKLGVFDSIVMFGNNFGLFGSFERAQWMLRRLKKLTSADARIVAETLDPYQTEMPEHLAYHRRNRKRGRMPGQLKIRVRYLAYATPWFDYLFVSQPEMRKIVTGTGWRVTRVFEDLPRYVAVIEKET